MPGNDIAVQYGQLAVKVKESEKLHSKIVESISPYYLR